MEITDILARSQILVKELAEGLNLGQRARLSRLKSGS